MQPELKAIIASFGLKPAKGGPVFSHTGSAGGWSVASLVIGMGPALAREATRKTLAAGPFDPKPAKGDPVFSHTGSAGGWSVASLVIGMGPALAREATRKTLAAGPFDHVMVVG